MLTVALICASIIGSSAAAITSAGPSLLMAVVCLHSAGFALGYVFSTVFGKGLVYYSVTFGGRALFFSIFMYHFMVIRTMMDNSVRT